MPKRALSLMPIIMAVAVTATAAEYTIDKDHSVFAIVTHKAGLASALAHDHFVHASDYEATLTVDRNAPESMEFSIELPAEKLRFDAADAEKEWFPKLKDAGIVEEPFSELSGKNRGKIRQSGLGEDQLDAQNHPTLKARVAAIQPIDNPDSAYTHEAELEFTVRGKTKTRTVKANITFDENELSVTAVGAFNFTDFDIEPYSAFLGAVRNEDTFHIFAHMRAEQAVQAGRPEPEAAG